MNYKKVKLKTMNLHFFLIPFLVLFLVFSIITYMSVKRHIRSAYETLEKNSLSIAESYTRRIVNSNFAEEIIIGLLDEKLLISSQTAILLEDKTNNEAVLEFAKKSFLDEVTIYNEYGEVINSTTGKMVGWKAYKTHPIYNFMTSMKDTLIEDIRANTETGVLYKYIYTRGTDGTIIQIGMLAEKINEFLSKFQLDTFINEIMANDYIENIFFTNNKYELVASGNDKYVDISFTDEEIHEHFKLQKAKAGREFIDGSDTLHVCAPVFLNDDKIGTLTIVWPSEAIYGEIKTILSDNIFRLILTSIILGGTIYYGYRKNRLNMKLAFYDKLTELPNDEYLKEYLREKLSDCDNNKYAVLLFNCQNFKIINLTYGFNYGDEILKQVTEILNKNLSTKDMLFRLEADKFAMVVSDYRNIEVLKKLSKKIIRDFKSFNFDMYKHEYLDLKIVFLELEDQNVTAEQILNDVSHGIEILRNISNENYLIYNREMREKLKREELIEKALLEVINGKSEDYLYMVYQPLLDIKLNRITGFEALARMRVPECGEISPLEFIDLAEKRNLIFPLGNIILRKSVEFLKSIREIGYTDISIAINISVWQLLRDEFIDSIKEIIGNEKVNWQQLVFKITESVLIENHIFINKKLVEIQDMGSLIALDDFGTGYSAFSELHNLNINKIKIDRSFVEEIGKFEENTLILEDIICMAQKLGLTVIAEGVETNTQLVYLKNHGCDIIQGFYISRPLTGSDAMEFLEHYSKQFNYQK